MSYLRKAGIGVDFSPLAGAFVRPTILPHDLDGIVEIDGQFLVLECKQENEEFSDGQLRSLQRLAREPNKLVIAVTLSGRRGPQGAFLFDPIALCRILPYGNGEFRETTLDEFIGYCRDWAGFRQWLDTKAPKVPDSVCGIRIDFS